VTPFRVREDDGMSSLGGAGRRGRTLLPALRLLSGTAEGTARGQPMVPARCDFALAKADLEALFWRAL
jgi:hypothetical protein